MAQTIRRVGDHGIVQAPAGDRALFTEFLVSARRRAGCSIDEIALVTRVPARHLDALEQGRVDDLPRGVYRRAIIRTYASAVGLDPALVLERFALVFGAETAFSEWQTVPPPSRVRAVAVTPPASSQAGPAGAQFGPPTLVSPRRAAPSHEPPRRTNAEPRPRRMIVATAMGTLLLLAAGYLLLTPEEAPSSPATAAAAPAPDTIPAPAAPGPDVRTADPASPQGGAVGDSLRRTADTTRPEPAPPQPAPGEPQDPPIADPVAESRLVITSTPPGARVTVDGVGWGVTPVTVRHLPPGVKTIRVTMDGYVGQDRQVRIGESGAVTARITLQPRE